MKKIMWIVAVLPVVVASMMLQVIPDMIPHKIGIFIFPIVILCVTFFWHLLIGTFEKKTVKASTDKERMEANSSARVLCVVGLSQNYFCCSRKLYDKGKAKYGSWVSNGLEYV